MSMQALLSASQSMVKMQAIQSVRTRMQGTANVLRAESMLDGGNKQKEEKAAALDEKSGKLMGNVMGEIADVNKAFKPDEDAKAKEDAKNNEASESLLKTDTIAFSDAASKQLGQDKQFKPHTSEAVTYKADGTAQSAPARASKKLEAFA